MKKILHTKLTSNDYVNKLLLSNPNLDTKFNYFYDNSVVHYQSNVKFIDILSAEIFEKRLTIDEFNHIIFDYFDLPNKLNQLSGVSKLDLINIDYFVHELKDDKSHEIREAIAASGYFLDEYTFDPYPEVRMMVAHRRHNLNILIHDECDYVRELAKNKLQEMGLE